MNARGEQLIFKRMQEMKSSKIGAAILLALMTLTGCDSLAGSALPSSKPVAALRTGSLTVSIYGDFSKSSRSTTAYVSDVDSLVLVIRQDGQADKTTTITSDKLSNGNTQLTYEDMPAGEVGATLTAYDADKAPLGTTTFATQILAGKNTVMPLVLRLEPNYVDPASLSTQAGTGSIAAHAYVLDGLLSTSSVRVTVYQDANKRWKFRPNSLTARSGTMLYLVNYTENDLTLSYHDRSMLSPQFGRVSKSRYNEPNATQVKALPTGPVTCKVISNDESDTLSITVID
jgi:hypothetical protein